MIHEELAVVHAGEDLDVGVRINSEQMFDLRLGSKGFLRAVPEVDVGAGDMLQLARIDGFIAIQHSLLATPRPGLAALVEQYIEVVGVEDELPEPRPMVTRPDVGSLVVPQGIDEPAGQG